MPYFLEIFLEAATEAKLLFFLGRGQIQLLRGCCRGEIKAITNSSLSKGESHHQCAHHLHHINTITIFEINVTPSFWVDQNHGSSL
jgi:hypothetical protein